MSQWYYRAVEGSVFGPVSLEELRQIAERGEITEQTLTRQGSDGAWQTAADVVGRYEEITAPSEILLAVEDEAAPVAESPDHVDEPAHLVRRSPLTLRPCADCGKMVSRHARACPDCGRAFHESTFEVPYAGEHPVPVWIFFTLVAVAFIVLSPMVVYRVVGSMTTSTAGSVDVSSQIALVAAAGYSLSMLVCAAIGGAVGAPRMAYFTGLLFGLFFGPLGVFAAFAIDKRPHCPNCFERLNGIARECPACHSGLTWVLARRWY